MMDTRFGISFSGYGDLMSFSPMPEGQYPEEGVQLRQIQVLHFKIEGQFLCYSKTHKYHFYETVWPVSNLYHRNQETIVCPVGPEFVPGHCMFFKPTEIP